MYDIGGLFQSPASSRVFIAAEIGINHNGNFDSAVRHMEKAKEAGADAVKFQVFRTEHFYNKKLLPGAYDLFRSFELSFDQYAKLAEKARSLDILFFATPLDPLSLDFLASIMVPVVKVASSDITCEPFLRMIADRACRDSFKVILSSGFVDMPAIRRAAAILKKAKPAVMYCVSKYPAEAGDFDLNFIPVLGREFGGLAGFSDHSRDIHLSLGAVALGAKLIERHFTVDNTLEGADHSMSLNPAVFSSLVKGIREIEKALGDGGKRITDFEREISRNSMRGMYAKRSLRKGETVTSDDVALLRPGKGVAEIAYKGIINKKLSRDVGEYEEI